MDDLKPDPAPAAPAHVPACKVRWTPEVVVVGASNKDAQQHEPKIQLIREDGVIQAIDITCRCGERIRVRCDYN